MTRRRRGWEPQPRDFSHLYAEQNPWRRLQRVPETLAPLTERPLARFLWQRLGRDPRRFFLIVGPRRVGKTTVMYQTVRHLLVDQTPPVPHASAFWLRVDHPLVMDEAFNTVRAALAAHSTAADPERPLYVFLDEVNYAAEWDLWLKTLYDERWPVKVVATASSAAALRQGRVESGIGRWDELYLPPFGFTELLDLLGVEAPVPLGADLGASLEEAVRAGVSLDLAPLRSAYLLTGGFPELILSAGAAFDDPTAAPDRLLASQRALRQDGVERTIYKDIPQVFGVIEPMKLERLLYVVAGQLGQILSPTSLAQTLQLSQPTIDRYLGFLERSFLVFLLPQYASSEETVQRRGRKLFFVDGAIRNAALQRGVLPLSDPTELGHLLENLVVAQLHTLALQTGVRLYHWRDKQDEVDVVYDHPTRPVALEIGSGRGHNRRGMRAFLDRHPQFRGRTWVVSPGAGGVLPDRDPEGIGAVSLDTLLVVAGRLAEEALGARLR